MIIDCKDISTIKALLELNQIKFIASNSKKIVYESTTYFVTNIYGYLGNGDLIRYRKIYSIQKDEDVKKLADEFSLTLDNISKEYKILIFEGTILDEDKGVKLFKP